MQSGEKVTDLCREFGISRKTAYKFIGRYEKHGTAGLHVGSASGLASSRRLCLRGILTMRRGVSTMYHYGA
jgi:hypothetical protein